VAAAPGETYRVQSNDTLWQIASAAYAGTRADVNRAMVAIYQANPEAFGGNINVLRAGSDLRMPSSSDVAAISASAAADEVARQYQIWREGATAAPTAAPDGGRLRLVTPEQGSAAPSTATEAAAAAAPSAELQSRVQQLEAELAEAQRLLEVRNAELATLQGSAAPAAEPAAPAEAALPAEGTEAAVPTEEAPAVGAEVQPVPEPEAAAPAEPEPQPESKPVAPAEPERSLLDRLGDYWWALLALLAAALGIVWVLRRRRASTSAEMDLQEVLGRRGDDLTARATTLAQREPSILVEERKPVEEAVARSAPAGAAAAQRAPEASRKSVSVEDTLSGEGPASIEAGDPLAEADFHMAYGLYDQAADLVQVASKREPQRRDLKLKLLEIFFVWGNKDRFLDVAREMGASRRDAQPGEWEKVLIMGRQLAPEDPLFAGAAGSAPAGLDMELNAVAAPLDMELVATRIDTAPDLDLTGSFAKVDGGEDGLDFILDEPVRGADVDTVLEPTIETTRRTRAALSDDPTAELPIATARMRTASSDDPTTELPIEDLGLDVGDVEGLDDLDDLRDLEKELTQQVRVAVDDTVERPRITQSDESDLLSTTSITKVMDDETIAQMLGEPEPGVIDLSEATGALPRIDEGELEATGLRKQPEFGIDGEVATMSEVGTKLDLARAYIDMGDPEGARSILDEVLKEGSPTQRKEAERLLAGLP
jgi:pilus assembly protein FimV